MFRQKRRPGFTLIELLVVIAIITVLVTLLLAAVQQSREAARRTQCKNHLKQIGLALHGWHDVHGSIPPAHSQDPDSIADYRDRPGAYDDQLYLSWLARILPFMEQENLYEQYDKDLWVWWQPLDPPGSGDLNGVPIPGYRCPSDPIAKTFFVPGVPGVEPDHTVALTSYLGVSGIDQFTFDGMIYVNSRVTLDEVTTADGTSNTFLVGERPPAYGGWTGWWFAGSGWYPWFGAIDVVLGSNERIAVNEACTPDGEQSWYQDGKPGDPSTFDDPHAWHFWSEHPGGAHFLIADGSVRFVSYHVAQEAFRANATRNNGEVESAF